MKAHDSVRSDEHAFTLIELLTVIAIIGILAAILIPVVGSVREKAKVSQCAVHLRDVGTAVQLYALDNNDFLPPHVLSNELVSEWGSKVGPSIHGVVGLLLAPEKGGPTITGWSGDYLDSPYPLFCPATREELYSEDEYKRPQDISENNGMLRVGYMWIYRAAGNPRENAKTTVDNPNRPYVFDFPAPGTSSLGKKFTYNPHQDRVNVLHVGGHVTSFSTEELRTNVPSGPSGTELFDYFTFRRRGVTH